MKFYFENQEKRARIRHFAMGLKAAPLTNTNEHTYGLISMDFFFHIVFSCLSQ